MANNGIESSTRLGEEYVCVYLVTATLALNICAPNLGNFRSDRSQMLTIIADPHTPPPSGLDPGQN